MDPVVPSSTTTTTAPGTSFVEWGAVFAGGAIAAAISFVLLTFGTSIGLSFVSPWANSSAAPKLVASLAVFWVMAQQIGAAIIGGYVAGRMRSRWGENTEHEVEFRDGLHGGLVWALGVIISAFLLLSAAASIARTEADIAGKALTTAATHADPLGYSVDTLLRTTSPKQPAGTAAAPSISSAGPVNEARAEVVRIVAQSIANDALTDADRTYLGGIVAQRTGLPQADAEKRVTDVFAQASQTAKDAADKARKAAILTGFVTAASLIVALGAAWWAAQRGGHHRDNSIPARFVGLSRRYP